MKFEECPECGMVMEDGICPDCSDVDPGGYCKECGYPEDIERSYGPGRECPHGVRATGRRS